MVLVGVNARRGVSDKFRRVGIVLIFEIDIFAFSLRQTKGVQMIAIKSGTHNTTPDGQHKYKMNLIKIMQHRKTENKEAKAAKIMNAISRTEAKRIFRGER